MIEFGTMVALTDRQYTADAGASDEPDANLMAPYRNLSVAAIAAAVQSGLADPRGLVSWARYVRSEGFQVLCQTAGLDPVAVDERFRATWEQMMQSGTLVCDEMEDTPTTRRRMNPTQLQRQRIKLAADMLAMVLDDGEAPLSAASRENLELAALCLSEVR